MIAPFDVNGNLPPGVYWATWQEILTRFGTNEHRKVLLVGLGIAMKLLRMAGCRTIYLDGSFVTSKEHPNDYDVAWDPAGVDLAKLDSTLKDVSNLRANQKMRFGGEFLVETSRNSMFEFFQTDRNGNRKGIVGIHLGDLP